jgi:hypothetical protein
MYTTISHTPQPQHHLPTQLCPQNPEKDLLNLRHAEMSSGTKQKWLLHFNGMSTLSSITARNEN